MSNFQMFINESRAVQRQRDMVDQAAAERSIKAVGTAMRMETQQRQQQWQRQHGNGKQAAQPEPAPLSPGSSGLRRAWGTFAGFVASFL